MLRFGRMCNSSQPNFETLKNLCGAQDVRNTGISIPWCFAIEEQSSVGSNRHMGSSLCESFPVSEQVHFGGDGLFVQMDEALPVLRTTQRIQRRWFRKITFPCFEFPRVVSGGEGSHFTRQDQQEVSQGVESKTTGLLLHPIPRPMARQKHLTRRSETFCRR